MHVPNELPDAPEWTPEPRPWDADGCCPIECPRVCETAHHEVWIRGDEWWMSDYFTLGNY